jgi:hypothetical protein
VPNLKRYYDNLPTHGVPEKAKNDSPHPPKKKLEICNVGHKLAAASGFVFVI